MGCCSTQTDARANDPVGLSHAVRGESNQDGQNRNGSYGNRPSENRRQMAAA